MSSVKFRNLVYSLQGLSDQLSLLADWIDENCVDDDYIRNAPMSNITLLFSKMKGVFASMTEIQLEVRSIKLEYEERQRERRMETLRKDAPKKRVNVTEDKRPSDVVTTELSDIVKLRSASDDEHDIATIVAMVIQQLKR